MENKALGFDYLHYYLFQNGDVENINSLINGEKNFSENDKTEVFKCINGIQSLIDKANSMQSSASQELVEEQIKFQREVHSLAKENTKNTYDTIMSIKESLQTVVKGAANAYNYVMIMYIIAFVLGIGLIITSIVFAAYDKAILAIAFGAIGLINLALTFLFKPPMEIQNSRSNFAQLIISITHWFSDLMNMNTYLTEKMQNISLEEMKAISDILGKNTEKIVDLIEKYSEIRKPNKEENLEKELSRLKEQITKLKDEKVS